MFVDNYLCKQKIKYSVLYCWRLAFFLQALPCNQTKGDFTEDLFFVLFANIQYLLLTAHILINHLFCPPSSQAFSHTLFLPISPNHWLDTG